MTWPTVLLPRGRRSTIAAGLRTYDVRMVRRLMNAVRLDASIAACHLVLNVLAGSALVPRPLRRLIYRAAGIEADTMNVFPGVRITGSNLALGAGTFVNHECYLDVAGGRIEIGRDCHLAPQVMVLAATHDLSSGGASRESSYETTTIGDRVWLGARATVLPGVTVGDGCVVAAGAVVASDCEPDGLYAGVPARRVKDLSPHARR